jgi:hypothetical protein
MSLVTKPLLKTLQNTLGMKFGDAAPVLYRALQDAWHPLKLTPPTFRHVDAYLCNHPTSETFHAMYSTRGASILALYHDTDPANPIHEIVRAYLVKDSRSFFRRLIFLGSTSTGYRVLIYNTSLISDDLPLFSHDYPLDAIDRTKHVLRQLRAIYRDLTV